MNQLRTVLLFACLLALAFSARAQDGDLLQYQQEIGGGIGVSSYLGDAGGVPLKNPGLMGTLIWRRNLNARMVIKTDLGLGHISGDTEKRFFPVDPLSKDAAGGAAAAPIHFSRNIVDVGAQFEFNFLGYGMGAAYKGLSRWTPYLLGGLGVTLGFGGGGKFCGGLNIPLGVGFRYKLKPRINVGIEWAVRFTTTDLLDDNGEATRLDAPYGIPSEGFKNKDCYQTLLVSLTYDISPKYRKCNN